LQTRDIVVIGGSAGSFDSLKTIVAGLPSDFPASIFVVVHVPAEFPSMLAKLLSQSGPLPATSPADQEKIQRGHIYVARPDHHLIIEDGKVRVQRGPRENRHRPAIDPLFRTAAREYGPRVIGIVLSGLQDDGSAGLYAVKQRGGIAIVQDPADTTWNEMPQHALAYASPHYILRTREIAPNLIQLVTTSETTMPKQNPKRKKNSGQHQKGTTGSTAMEQPDENMQAAHSEEGDGNPSVFACPECHGVLWELKDGDIVRFRCRVGHSFGAESLTGELSLGSEAALWAAVRALEEKGAMQRRMAEGMARQSNMAKRLLDQSAADDLNARLIRDMIFQRDAELEKQEPQFEPESNDRKTA
jgi:two-component system chemotaxis response regulator CheB